MGEHWKYYSREEYFVRTKEGIFVGQVREDYGGLDLSGSSESSQSLGVF